MSRRLGIAAVALAALLAFGCEHYPRRHHGPTPGFRYYWGERRRDDDHDRHHDRDRQRYERRRGDDDERRGRRQRHRD